MEIRHLEEIITTVQGRIPRRLVAVNAVDDHTLEAVNAAVDRGIVRAILTGDRGQIETTCASLGIDPEKFTIEDVAGEEGAARRGVELITEGKADLMMKGLLSTDKYMKAILNKDFGLLPPKGVLSHVTVMENPGYHKLLVVGDVAIIPYPDLAQKIVMTGYLIRTAQALGIEKPKVALIAATEQVLTAIPACTEAAIIAKMAERGQISGALIDGPMALDVAIDAESAAIKKISNPVAGDADCLLFPNIDAGNVFYKMSARMCRSEQAAIVAGARVPLVLSSRGDTMQTKLYSIALAAMLG
ncbi:MAG: phosphate butyryltransferase [Bacteroidales bacterium]|nr:phosphate butyryltransferase [Bacteroidales bacterium]